MYDQSSYPVINISRSLTQQNKATPLRAPTVHLGTRIHEHPPGVHRLIYLLLANLKEPFEPPTWIFPTCMFVAFPVELSGHTGMYRVQSTSRAASQPQWASASTSTTRNVAVGTVNQTTQTKHNKKQKKHASQYFAREKNEQRKSIYGKAARTNKERGGTHTHAFPSAS